MEHKSMWTRLFAAFAAVLLTLGIAAPAFAAVTPDAKGTVTLSGIEQGAEVNAYQLIEVGYNGNDPSGAYFWNKDVAAWLKQNGYSALVDSKNGAVTEQYKVDKPLYGKLAGDIKAGKLALKPAGTAASNGGDVSLQLPQGGYLILVSNSVKYVYETIVTNIYPTYADGNWSLTTDPVNINVKREEISIDKTADGEDHTGAQIGDVIKFKIEAMVPGYPEGAQSTVFNIVDTMSKGLTFNNDLKVVAFKGDTETPLAEGTHYTKDTQDSAVTFKLVFDYDQVKGFDKVVVTYTGTLNDLAVVGPDGNTNNAKLEWSNDPFDQNGFKPGDGTTDETKVYTYGIDILKVAKDNQNTKLTGAVFEAYNAKNEKLSFISEGNGVYRLPKKGETGTTTELAVGKTGANVGRLILDGLNVGSYSLKEIKAPEGYALPSSNFPFTIKDANVDGIVDENVLAENNGYVTGHVENSKGFSLPTTGGAGTVAITAAGVLVMAGAGLYLVRSRKQQ